MDAIMKGQQIDLVTRQSIAKEILRFTARVLDALSIPFYLIGGSALGAVRHGDIIPRDDDIDIGVPREGYRRLIESFPADGRYALLHPSITRGYYSPMVKVVDRRTLLEESMCHAFEGMGVFIDVFPLDFAASQSCAVRRGLFMKRLYNYSYVLDWSRDETRRLGVAKFCFSVFARLATVGRTAPEFLGMVEASLDEERDEADSIFNLWGAWQERELVPAEWFGEGALMGFGGETYPVPEKWDLYLTRIYGDYMKPPESVPHTHGGAWFRRGGSPMRRVITYGTFDLLHYGHINLLKRARECGDYLIVALSTDEFNWGSKRKRCYFPYEKRKALLESIRYVDLVIPEESWGQKRRDIHEYHVDTFVMGDDWEGEFDFLREEGCEVMYLPRTPEISTSQIKRDLKCPPATCGEIVRE